MTYNFIEYKESENVVPSILKDKEKYYYDLMNIEHSWTGRLDAMFSHTFFLEAVQLVVNAIVLFEKGYFDCAFYSLRQSLEISTTVVYFADDNESNRENELKKWKRQEKFPMNAKMMEELNKRQSVFADIKNKMNQYFEEIEVVKKRLNKYVHKQGFDKFYVSRKRSIHREKHQITLLSDFEIFLIKTIGAIAVFRLAIDPIPLLLMDEDIFNRTGQLMTDAYSEDFISKYIGLNHIQDYKETDTYRGHYDFFISQEEMLPSVIDVVKNDFIDREKINEIRLQRNLLGESAKVALEMVSYSEKIAKVHCYGGLHWYFTNVETKRTVMSWSTKDFDDFKNAPIKWNNRYDEAFITYIIINNNDYFIEHNEEFTLQEIEDLMSLKIT